MVQLPASAIENITASLPGLPTGAASGKRGELPPFANIFAEQSADANAGKDGGAWAGVTDDGGRKLPTEAASPDQVFTNPKILLNPPREEMKYSQDVHADLPSRSGASADRKTNAGGRQTSERASGAPGKKQTGAVTDQTPVPVLMTTPLFVADQPAPIVNLKGGPHTLINESLPQKSDMLQAHTSGLQGEKEKGEIPSPTTTAFEVVAPDGKSLVQNEVQPQATANAKTQQSAALSATEPSSGASSLIRQEATKLSNGSSVADQPLQSSSPAETNRASLSPAVFASADPASLTTKTGISKPVTREMTNSNFATGTVAPTVGLGASSPETIHSHAVPGTTPSAAFTVNSADLGSQEGSTTHNIDTFQRLDAGALPATLLHSSPHQIAVGVRDPSLGWLEVQTQSSSGHISATLTAASAEAHASLAAQAPAITQYLADRSVSIHSLNVHAQADMQGGASGQGQSPSGHGNTGQDASVQGEMATGQTAQQSLSETKNQDLPQAGHASYISIRA